MTREEIISGLKFTVEMFLFDPSTGEKYTEPRNDMDKTTIDACRGAIELLEQEPKIGHWIAQDIHNCHTDFKCSECGYIHSFMHIYGEPTADYTYCPNCGAKMFESQESEVTE